MKYHFPIEHFKFFVVAKFNFALQMILELDFDRDADTKNTNTLRDRYDCFLRFCHAVS